MQYSISNLNAFIILVAIGYSLYLFVEKEDTEDGKGKQEEEKASLSITTEEPEQVKSRVGTGVLDQKDKFESNMENVRYEENTTSLSGKIMDRDNSPMQLISQLKGYFYINPMLAISLSVTLFSFIGVPPLIGFFAKQMVLSSALDNGYVFVTFIAILSSVISAYYYLVLVKQIFFNKSDYVLNPVLNNTTLKINAINEYSQVNDKTIEVNVKNIQLSSCLSVVISILTLIILLFILNPQE